MSSQIFAPNHPEPIFSAGCGSWMVSWGGAWHHLPYRCCSFASRSLGSVLPCCLWYQVVPRLAKNHFCSNVPSVSDDTKWCHEGPYHNMPQPVHQQQEVVLVTPVLRCIMIYPKFNVQKCPVSQHINYWTLPVGRRSSIHCLCAKWLWWCQRRGGQRAIENIHDLRRANVCYAYDQLRIP